MNGVLNIPWNKEDQLRLFRGASTTRYVVIKIIKLNFLWTWFIILNPVTLLLLCVGFYLHAAVLIVVLHVYTRMFSERARMMR